MNNTQQNRFSWLASASREDMARAVEALYRVHGLMAALTDLDTLLERIGEEGRQVARAEAASVMLYDEAAGELYFRVALGDTGDQEALKREIRLKQGQGIAGAAALSRATIHVPDVSRDSRFFGDADVLSRFQTRNLLAVPMIERNRLVGVLELLNKVGDGAFSPLDQRLMEMFSAVAASAVVNARLIEQQIRTERLAALGQAIAGMTHHIKNLLTGLNSSAELIEMALDADNLSLIRKTWPVQQRSTQRISFFVQDLLLYAKPRRPDVRPCDLPAILRDACETVQDLFARKEIALDIRHLAGAEPVHADADGLFRCLLNLLTNAADAAPLEGGRIMVCTRRDEAGRIEIDVIDNGPGIPPPMREKIFDPFFSTKGAKGTGLGLACAAKIAMEHGGALSLADHEGDGACFRITLPTPVGATQRTKEQT